MSKKYKDRLCVYCGERLSTAGDHVWAREFCLVEHRDNLPQVPACDQCNNEKSRLEHYLATVLPFGGRHPQAVLTLETMVPKRLERNAKLQRQLGKGYTGEKIPLERGRIDGLFGFVAKGLASHHWQATFGLDDCAAATVLHADGARPLNWILSKLKPRKLTYEGLQTIDGPNSTLWRFLIYGGVCFADSSRDPDVKHSLVFAVTGPRALLPRFWATVFKEEFPAA